MSVTRTSGDAFLSTVDPSTPGGARPPASLGVGPGTRVRQYELIRELGRGGMGQVFLARDTRLGRLVAMKFVTSSSSDLTERFLREARTTARCTHPSIVVVHDVDEHEGL